MGKIAVVKKVQEEDPKCWKGTPIKGRDGRWLGKRRYGCGSGEERGEGRKLRGQDMAMNNQPRKPAGEGGKEGPEGKEDWVGKERVTRGGWLGFWRMGKQRVEGEERGGPKGDWKQDWKSEVEDYKEEIWLSCKKRRVTKGGWKEGIEEWRSRGLREERELSLEVKEL